MRNFLDSGLYRNDDKTTDRTSRSLSHPLSRRRLNPKLAGERSAGNLFATEPAAVYSEGSIIHDDGDSRSLGFGFGNLVNHPVLKPDVLDTNLDGFIHDRSH